ncbi:uncharacterized protein VTP21DRAFT_4382 [Calcarisporiella thermophila]|uniref:uncharacterized protein n=1 Tax=Calcarisporiella thermophila TaxID=911321 RepID=UPI0037424903
MKTVVGALFAPSARAVTQVVLPSCSCPIKHRILSAVSRPHLSLITGTNMENEFIVYSSHMLKSGQRMKPGRKPNPAAKYRRKERLRQEQRLNRDARDGKLRELEEKNDELRQHIDALNARLEYFCDHVLDLRIEGLFLHQLAMAAQKVLVAHGIPLTELDEPFRKNVRNSPVSPSEYFAFVWRGLNSIDPTYTVSSIFEHSPEPFDRPPGYPSDERDHFRHAPASNSSTSASQSPSSALQSRSQAPSADPLGDSLTKSFDNSMHLAPPELSPLSLLDELQSSASSPSNFTPRETADEAASSELKQDSWSPCARPVHMPREEARGSSVGSDLQSSPYQRSRADSDVFANRESIESDTADPQPTPHDTCLYHRGIGRVPGIHLTPTEVFDLLNAQCQLPDPPEVFIPTPLQLRVKSGRKFDSIACATWRDRLLLYEGAYDEDELFEMMAYHCYACGDPLVATSWYASDEFYERYPFLYDADCPFSRARLLEIYFRSVRRERALAAIGGSAGVGLMSLSLERVLS